MGFYKTKLDQARAELKAIYDPATALSDPRVGSLNGRIEQLETEMDGKRECEDCDGWGTINCDECGQERTCSECGGDGLVDHVLTANGQGV